MKRRNMLLFILGLFLIPMTIVKADLFASATFKTDTKGTGKLSDDYIYFELPSGSLITDANAFKAFVTTNQQTYSSSCYENASAISSAGAVGIASIDSSTQKFKINLASDKMNTFAQSNEKVYVKMYVQNGSGQYCPSDTALKEVNLATPAERLRDMKISINKKDTLELTDDVITISDAYLSSDISNYKVVITESIKSTGSPSEGTDLTKSGNTYSFASSYYATKVGYDEFAYLYIYKGDTLVKGGVKIEGHLGADVFKTVNIKFLTQKDDQTNINLEIRPLEIYPVENYYAFFTKNEDTNDMGFTQTYNAAISTIECRTGTPLEQVAVVDDTYYELKNNSCYIEKAQQKGDTYVTFYKRIPSEKSTCTYDINSDGVVVKNCPQTPITGDEGTFKKITNSYKINRPADLPLGARINMNVTPTSSLFYMLNLSGVTGGHDPVAPVRNATYKIGLVDDKAILRNIRDAKDGAFEALLEYARKNSSKTTGTIKIQPNKAIATDIGAVAGALYTKDNVSGGSYYYLYINYDGKENNVETYYPIEDVQIFKANKNSKGELELLAKDEIKWTDIGESESAGSSSSSTSKKKNPKTGIISYTIITLSVAIIALIIYLKTKKVTKFPESEKAS